MNIAAEYELTREALTCRIKRCSENLVCKGENVVQDFLRTFGRRPRVDHDPIQEDVYSVNAYIPKPTLHKLDTLLGVQFLQLRGMLGERISTADRSYSFQA